MKKILEALYKVLCQTSILFFGIVMFFALFLLNTTTANLSREVILSFFGFSAFFGVCALLDLFIAIPSVLKAIVRFILTTVGFVVCLLVSFERSSAQMFVSVAFFAVVYWIIFLIVKLVKLPFKKKEAPEEL